MSGVVGGARSPDEHERRATATRHIPRSPRYYDNNEKHGDEHGGGGDDDDDGGTVAVSPEARDARSNYSNFLQRRWKTTAINDGST